MGGASQVFRGWSFREMNDELLSVVRDSTGHREAWVGRIEKGKGPCREAHSRRGTIKSQGGGYDAEQAGEHYPYPSS
jgi:hypothetical protein